MGNIKIPSEYVSFLQQVEEMKGYEPFDIKTSKKYTKSELCIELEAKEFPAEDIIGVRMLSSMVLWRITVQQSGAELFRKICPWEIIPRDTGEQLVGGGSWKRELRKKRDFRRSPWERSLQKRSLRKRSLRKRSLRKRNMEEKLRNLQINWRNLTPVGGDFENSLRPVSGSQLR
ncbi:MAG: hypothetical protein M1839_004364 [Geoglossum umbratile]|nr:MAG: hypothetical protein M1839_004364 [Geoglossum umbratile]